MHIKTSSDLFFRLTFYLPSQVNISRLPLFVAEYPLQDVVQCFTVEVTNLPRMDGVLANCQFHST